MVTNTAKLKTFFRYFLIVFGLMNIVAYFHAYKFTHFSNSIVEKTKSPEKLSMFGKIQALAFGVSNPRPSNKVTPRSNFNKIDLQSNFKIECWDVPSTYTDASNPTKGTIIIFHGFSGEKSSMLDKAGIFDSLNLNCLLIDFMGSGGSEGNTSTIGFKEAEQVKTAFDYLQSKGVKNIYLFGTSMGAAAVMKAINDYKISPRGIILECPFGTMYDTVSARFRNMNVPAFPMANLLVFWGGVQNGFWAFNHNPIDYAKKISTPTLLMYGNQDQNITRQETDGIFKNLNGRKRLKIFEQAGHENYLIKYRHEWTKEVDLFLKEN
jgi:uncharacterized protein